jgi:bacteriorhodopsin
MIDNESALLGGVTLLLVFVVLLFSLSFQTPYNKELRFLARQPFFRFLAYLLILLGMEWNPIVGSLTFLIVIFWFYDIHLLSG